MKVSFKPPRPLLEAKFALTKATLFFLSFFLSCIPIKALQAQESMIFETVVNLPDLDVTETLNYSKLLNDPTYSDLYFVKFLPLAELQQAGRIVINLPDDDCEDLVYQVEAVEYRSDDDYVWTGVLEAGGDTVCECHTGAVTLISSVYGKIGHITVDEKSYEIIQISTERFVLAKIDHSIFTEDECAVTETDNSSLDFDFSEAEIAELRNEGNCNVRCLVLFTEAAELISVNINLQTMLAVQQTNLAFRNSDISACELTLELVGVLPFDGPEGDNIVTDLNTFIDDVNGEMTILRNEAEADIVVLMNDGDYEGVFGAAFQGPDAARPFAIVRAGAIPTAAFTFSHEVGHLLGAHHTVVLNNPAPGFNRAHEFKTGDFLPCIIGARRTTLLHPPNRVENLDRRVLHYSNPDIFFEGKPTGVENERDNVRNMRNVGCQVAQFINSPEPFTVGIYGDEYACPCHAAFVEATVFGGTAGDVYDYDWFESEDGINWMPLVYSGQNAAIQVSCEEGEVTFVRVDVTSVADGTVHTAVSSVESALIWPDQEAPCMLFDDSDDSLVQAQIQPNPSSVAPQVITVTVKEAGTFRLTIVDSRGMTIETLDDNRIMEKGQYQYQTVLRDQGLYFLICENKNGHRITKKIIRL